MKLRELINRAVKPRLHERFGQLTLQVDEFDDQIDVTVESSSSEGSNSLSGLSLVLEYENSKRERSQRIVTCRQFSIEAGKEYLKAYCHHREAIRTFRIDRIVEIFDPATGECLSPVQSFFARYQPDKIAASGLSWGLSVGRRADLIALLNALVFVARCDKEYHPAERACLEKALTGFWLRFEILGDPDFDEILAYADRLAPDGEIFWAAMQRFAEDLMLANLFKRQAQMLIEADGIVLREEAYWLLEIGEFLGDD